MAYTQSKEPNIRNSANLSYYDESKLSERDIEEITSWIKRDGKVSSWEVSMVYGSDRGLMESGQIVEKDGYLLLAEKEVKEPILVLAEAKTTETLIGEVFAGGRLKLTLSDHQKIITNTQNLHARIKEEIEAEERKIKGVEAA